MRTAFVISVLDRLLCEGKLARSDSVLAVCAGAPDRDVFAQLGFTNVLITNLDERIANGDRFAPFEWSSQDAQALSFDDRSFDFAFVADGLHHCSSPHRALLEMYRVARKGIVAIESRDNLLMRTATRLNLSPEYELEAVVDNEFRWGGLNNTEIPNYIYRWTESDFRKVIRSFNPTGSHVFHFFYALNLPYEQAELKKTPFKLHVVRVADPILRGFTRLFPKQCNTLAMIAVKPQIPNDLWPWLKSEDGKILFNCDYADQHFKSSAVGSED